MSTCNDQLLNPALRRYQLIPKHAPGGFGTLMDLDDAVALDVLQTAAYDPKAAEQGVPSLWGFRNGKVYRFMCDGCAVATWHGYPTEEKPPTAVLREWMRQGTISAAEYNRMIRRVGRGN
jgi:hypothetical protein